MEQTENQPDVTMPKPKKIRIYTALLTQEGTSAPTAVVLLNTLGYDVIWTRVGVGTYRATATGAGFKAQNCAVFTQPVFNNVTVNGYFNNANSIEINTSHFSPQGVAQDYLLTDTPIEIRIYREEEE